MNRNSQNKNNKQEIMVVEDTLASLQLLTKILTDAGYRVRPAINGKLALQSLAVRLPDLILLDIKIPDINGYEICRHLKADKSSKDIPVIFLSALEETAEKIEGFNAGGVDYITKPYEVEEVLARVRTHLHLRELTEKLEQKVKERTEELTLANKNLKREVFERTETEKRLKFQNIILSTQQETSLDGILVVDEKGEVLSYNRRFQEIWNFSTELIEFKNDRMLLQHALKRVVDPQEFMDKVNYLYQNNNKKSHEEILFKDGRIIDRYSSPMFGEDSKYLGRVWYFQDITDRKKAEESLRKNELELRRFNEELETRVKKRTIALEKANKELLETLNKLKQTQSQLVESEKMAALGSLVAGVAHEINTPIGIGVTAASHLNSQIDSLKQCYEDGTLKRSQLEELFSIITEGAGLILSNLERAIHLIQSFKQIAVDQSSGEHRCFNLKIYIGEILSSLQHKLKRVKHKIIVKCPENLELESYPSAFYQIFTNLIINSLLHGFKEKKDGIIEIDIRKNNNKISIVFSDNGDGIPPENLKHIFEPFFTTRRNMGGSGLGLNIAYNQVTQTLKGTIKCESKEGEGTRFLIDFPVECINKS